MPRPKCDSCNRPFSVCYCHTIQRNENAWPVHILQHPQEVKHAIGTARIAQLSLSQCTTYVGDRAEQHTDLEHLISLQSPLLVYPSDDAIALHELSETEVRPLIFLDASWRKSKRMLHESALLNTLPKLSITPTSSSNYRIRKSPSAEALSTLEAIVEVLTWVEKSKDYQPLLNSMQWMIDRQIEAMGNDLYQQNYSPKN